MVQVTSKLQVHYKQPCKADQYSLLCYRFGVFFPPYLRRERVAHQVGALFFWSVKEVFSITY